MRRYHFVEMTEINQYIGPIRVMKINTSNFIKSAYICYQWPLRNKTTISNLENVLKKIQISSSETAYFNIDEQCYKLDNECIKLIPYDNCGDARTVVDIESLEDILFKISLISIYSDYSYYISKYIIETDESITLWFSDLNPHEKSIMEQMFEYRASQLNQYLDKLEAFNHFYVFDRTIETIDDLIDYISDIQDQFKIELNSNLQENIQNEYQLHNTMINILNLFVKYYMDILIRCDIYNIKMLDKVYDNLIHGNTPIMATLLLKENIRDLFNEFKDELNLFIVNLEDQFSDNHIYLQWKLHLNLLFSSMDMDKIYDSCLRFQSHNFKVAEDPIDYISFLHLHNNNNNNISLLTWSFNDPYETIIEEYKLINLHSSFYNDIILSYVSKSEDPSPIISEIVNNRENYYLHLKSNLDLNGFIHKTDDFSNKDVMRNKKRNLSILSLSCDPGYYSYFDESENEFICQECEEGYYCPGDSFKYICDNGPSNDTIYPLKGIKDPNCPFLCNDEKEYMHQNKCKPIPYDMVYNRISLELSDCVAQLPSSFYKYEDECDGYLYNRAIIYQNQSPNELENWISNVNIAGNDFIIAMRFKLDYIEGKDIILLKVNLFWTLSIHITKYNQDSYMCYFKFVLKGKTFSENENLTVKSDEVSLEKGHWYHISVHGNFIMRTIIMYLNNINICSKWYDITLLPDYTLSRADSSVIIGPPINVKSELSVDDIGIIKSPGVNIEIISPLYTNPIEYILSGCNLEINDYISTTNECLSKCKDGYERDINGECLCNSNKCRYDKSITIQNSCDQNQYVLWVGEYISIRAEINNILITEIYIYDEHGTKIDITDCYIESEIENCNILGDGDHHNGLTVNKGLSLRIGLSEEMNISRIHIYADQINDSSQYTNVSIFIFTDEINTGNNDYIVIQDWKIKLNEKSNPNKQPSELSPSLTPQAIFNMKNTKCIECENGQSIIYNNDAIFCLCKETDLPCPEFNIRSVDLNMNPSGVYFNSLELEFTVPEGYEDNPIVLHILNSETKIIVLFHVSYPIILKESSTVIYYLIGDDYYTDIKIANYRIYGDCSPPIIYPNGSEMFTNPQYIFIVTQDNLKIYYTVDGSDPTKKDELLYKAPFVISTNATIKAFSHSTDGLCKDSEIVYVSILFNIIDEPSNSPSLRFQFSQFILLMVLVFIYNMK